MLGVLGFDQAGRGGSGEDGLVKLLFSAAVWTFAAFNLTLDIVRLTNRLLPYFWGEGSVNLLRKPCVGLKVYPKMSPYDNNERLAGLLISCYTF